MLGIRALCVYGVRLGYTFALFWRNHSLNRTLRLCLEDTFARKTKLKRALFWRNHSLNRTLRLRLEDTFARKTKLKQALFWFSLAYSYSEVAPPRYSLLTLSSSSSQGIAYKHTLLLFRASVRIYPNKFGKSLT